MSLRRLVCRLHKTPLYGRHSTCPSTVGKLSYYCQTCGFVIWASAVEGSSVVDDIPEEDEEPTFGYATEEQVMTANMLQASKQGRLALIQLNAKHNAAAGDAEQAEVLRLEGQLQSMRHEMEQLRDLFRQATRAPVPKISEDAEPDGGRPEHEDSPSELRAASAAGPVDMGDD